MDRTTLTDWRRDTASLTLTAAAARNRMSESAVAAFELRPGSASLHALHTYVTACGGRLRVIVELGAEARELAL